MLIVLDNFEQIVDAAPQLVRLYTVAPLATLPGDEPGRAAHPRRAGLRGRDPADTRRHRARQRGARARGRRRSSCSSTARRRSGRSSASPPRTPPPSRTSAGGSTDCRWRSSSPPRKCACSPPRAIAQRLEHSLPAADRLRARSARSASHDARDDRLERRPASRPSERALLEDLGVFATRFTLEAVEAIGRGRAWDGQSLDALSRPGRCVARQAGRDRRTVDVLAARDHARVRDRPPQGARRSRSRCGSRTPTTTSALVRRLAPDLRGPGQPEAVAAARAGAAEPPRGGAASRLHRTGSTKPATSPGASWSTGGSPGSSARCGCGCWSSSTRSSPSRRTPERPRPFFTMWGEMWRQPVRRGRRRCSASPSVCSPRAATRMPRPWRWPPAATTRLQFPDLDADTAEAELNEAVAKLHELGDGWAESMAEVGLGLLAVVRGADRGSSRSLRTIGAGRRRGPGPVHAGRRGQQPRARALHARATSRLPSRSGALTLGLSARLHYDEGAAYALEGMSAVAASRGDGWRAGALADGRRGHQAEHGNLRRRGVRGSRSASGRAPRQRSRRASTAGEQRGRRYEPRRGDRTRAARRRCRPCREALAQW